jgi:hypothetical protein
MTTPFQAFLENGWHVTDLLELHKEKNAKKKTHHAYEVLPKSCVVLLVACWEAFLEDVAETGVKFLVDKSVSPTMLPKSLLGHISAELKQDRNELRVWDLADEGWKRVVKDHYKVMLAKHLGPFNTPKAGNVDNLFKATMGIENLSSCWSWKGMPNKDAKDKLGEIVSLRGSIAHRVNASKKVTRALANRHGIHLLNLAIKTSNHVRHCLHSATGEYPWVEESYKSVK